MTLPKHIVATRKFIYDIEQMSKDWNETNDSDATEEDIWELITEYVAEDLRSAFEDSAIVYLDEDGERIYPELV